MERGLNCCLLDEHRLLLNAFRYFVSFYFKAGGCKLLTASTAVFYMIRNVLCKYMVFVLLLDMNSFELKVFFL